MASIDHKRLRVKPGKKGVGAIELKKRQNHAVKRGPKAVNASGAEDPESNSPIASDNKIAMIGRGRASLRLWASEADLSSSYLSAT